MSLSRESMLMDPEDHVGIQFDEDRIPTFAVLCIGVLIGILIVVLTTPLSSN